MMDGAESALGVNVVDDLGKLAARRMRMLRLAKGWSAEQLSQKYEEGGAGSLTRATIAKIESDNRQIKAGEVAGVARVFGLTSTDLLDPDWPDVYLSYAEQDDAAGREIAAWLAGHGFRVHSAGLPAADQPRTGAGERAVIDTAQAFVLLLSPSFLSSPRCREELDAAVRREQQLISDGLATDFIYVLGIAETPDLDKSGLQSYPLMDLAQASDWSKAVELSKLGGSVVLSARVTAARPGPVGRVQAGRASLDRGEELQRVLYGLNNPAGPRFWLVISPPGLGKTWFLEQLAARAAVSAVANWDTRTVDLRREPDDLQHDAMAVVKRLFGIEQSAGSGDDYLGVAQKIIRSGHPWLCQLDSAELLPPSTIAQLRQHLGRIYRLVQDARSAEASLAFVVASRRNDGWKGLTPYPSPSVLPLDGFEPATIQAALEELARTMSRAHSPAVLRQDAALVHRVTEGVPELVQECLTWIHDEEWLEVDRLDDPRLSETIVAPYVRNRLLAPDSLLGGETGEAGEAGEAGEKSQPEKSAKQLAALRAALRALVPYRLFTLSHVRHHLEDDDPTLRDAVKDAGWSPDELWQAIADMALLRRPLDEPWQEIHPAIRRLLYRCFYTPDERVDAHVRARDFTKTWAAQLTGKEHAIGMVESIWHEAVRLRLSSPGTMGEDLPRFARKLSLDVSPSPSPSPSLPSYTDTELRDYAAQRIENDDELRREVDDIPYLFEKLAQIVRTPQSQVA
jgi:transcriptional regulator with XRE-family HTH domain